MKQLFLYGDVSRNFEGVSKPFIQASGGANAEIALLLQGGPEWKKYLPRYTNPWMRLGAKKVLPITPISDSTLDEDALNIIRNCTGVFVAGGDTRIYQKVYASDTTGFLIKSLFEKGIPIGGVSAGAVITPSKCIIQGGLFITPSNEYYLRAKPFVENMDDVSLSTDSMKILISSLCRRVQHGSTINYASSP